MKKFLIILVLLMTTSCSSIGGQAEQLKQEVETLNTNLRDIKQELEKLRKTLVQFALSMGAKPEDFADPK